MSAILRLATRGSDLALAQTREVARRLREARPGLEVSEVIIRTTGDKDTESDLSQAAETGLFTKELEAALLDSRADAAVHSLKDLPTTLPSGLELAAVLPRADCSDVLVSMTPGGL
ncbi:MAG: hydroxymethylbilane synthase, partial [Chthoniobacterales bacterium]